MDNKIFIIGHARSGSTLLCDFLNTDRQVYLLKEGELYWRTGLPSFPEYFNRRGAARELAWLKGNYVPPFVPPDTVGEAVLTRLADFYPRVGDKIALGPDRPEQSNIWDYYASHHFHSAYIFTFRGPVEAVASMRRMFPGSSYDACITAWLQTMELMIKFRDFLPNVFTVPMVRFSGRVFESLNAKIGLDAIVSGGAIHPPEVAVGLDALPGIGPDEATRLQSCTAIYNELNYTWDVEKLQCHYDHNVYEYWQQYSQRVARALGPHGASYPPERTPATDPRRAVLAAYADTRYLNTEWLRIVEGYIEDYPEDGYGHYIIGIMRVREHQQEKALSHFDKALAYGHDNFWVRYNRAHLEKNMKQPQRALEDVEIALSLDPEHAGAQQLSFEIQREMVEPVAPARPRK